MNIVVAPDSFKECLTAKQVAGYIAQGIKKAMPDANITQIPISDGGEGLLNALEGSVIAKLISVEVNDPLFRTIRANYGISEDGAVATIEMAKASGLELLKENEKNPLITSTYGTGQLIADALNRGCSKIIIGLGGSATNDGGMGMLKALGVKFLNKKGEKIGDGGGALNELCRIDFSELDNRLSTCEIIGACDVSNPLTGTNGASLVFGGQKGGNAKELKQLDKNLLHYASIIKSDVGVAVDAIAGAGAAGGMGAALLAFFSARLTSGINLIIELLQVEKHIKHADLVITGEGKIDVQTLYGKVVVGVAKIAKKNNVPVIAIAGKVEGEIKEMYKLGVNSVFSISNKPMELSEALNQANHLIVFCVENIMRTINIKHA